MLINENVLLLEEIIRRKYGFAKIQVFRRVTACRLVRRYRGLGGPLVSIYELTQPYIPDD